MNNIEIWFSLTFQQQLQTARIVPLNVVDDFANATYLVKKFLSYYLGNANWTDKSEWTLFPVSDKTAVSRIYVCLSYKHLLSYFEARAPAMKLNTSLGN